MGEVVMVLHGFSRQWQARFSSSSSTRFYGGGMVTAPVSPFRSANGIQARRRSYSGGYSQICWTAVFKRFFFGRLGFLCDRLSLVSCIWVDFLVLWHLLSRYFLLEWCYFHRSPWRGSASSRSISCSFLTLISNVWLLVFSLTIYYFMCNKQRLTGFVGQYVVGIVDWRVTARNRSLELQSYISFVKTLIL